jgi:hypothetical protein
MKKYETGRHNRHGEMWRAHSILVESLQGETTSEESFKRNLKEMCCEGADFIQVTA